MQKKNDERRKVVDQVMAEMLVLTPPTRYFLYRALNLAIAHGDPEAAQEYRQVWEFLRRQRPSIIISH